MTANVESAMLVKSLKPLALQRQGEVVDKAFQTGDMNSVKEWCKQARGLDLRNGSSVGNLSNHECTGCQRRCCG